MYRNTYYFLLYSFLCFNLLYSGNKIVKADNGSVFSIEFSDESLNSCIEKIAELSGYEIFVSENYYDHKISINLKTVTIEKSLTRILKGINHAIIWDEEHRKLTIILYGIPSAHSGTKKFTGLPPMSSVKPIYTDKTGPSPNLPVFHMSNRSSSEGPDASMNSKHPFRDSNLNVSGTNTIFVQGTPSGHFDP